MYIVQGFKNNVNPNFLENKTNNYIYIGWGLFVIMSNSVLFFKGINSLKEYLKSGK